MSKTEPLPIPTRVQPTARPWWRRPRWVVVGTVSVACVVVFVSAWLVPDFRAERRYRAAVADADRLDPGWRAEFLVSRLQPIPRNGVGRDADAGFRLWDPGRRRQPPKPAAKKAQEGGQ